MVTSSPRDLYTLLPLNATEDSHTDIHAKRITLQAIENASNPALQDVRPSDEEYIYALTHHLSDTLVTDFHTIMDAPNMPSNSCLTPRTWDSNAHIATNAGHIKITSWTLQRFKTRLTYQEHTLHCINNTIHGPDHSRSRFLNLYPYYQKEKALGTYYQHLLTVMHAPNKHKFLAYYLIRELEILHDGNLFDNLVLYAIRGQTITNPTIHPDTLDPFNISTSQLMTSYLSRFYSRTERDSIYVKLSSRTKCIPKLNWLRHTFSPS